MIKIVWRILAGLLSCVTVIGVLTAEPSEPIVIYMCLFWAVLVCCMAWLAEILDSDKPHSEIKPS